MLTLLFVTLCSNAVFSQSSEEEEVFQVVENQPEYPGGNEAMFKFITENMVYPEDALKENIQGKVYIRFVVRKDGSLSNIEVVRGAHTSLDKEAVRVIAMMPNWKPGSNQGKNVSVQYTLPIYFKI